MSKKTNQPNARKSGAKSSVLVDGVPNYFISYKDQYDVIASLTDEQVGKLYKALHAFAFSGVREEPDDPVAAVMFRVMSAQVERDIARYLQKAQAGRTGGIRSGISRRSKAQRDTAQAERSAENADTEPPCIDIAADDDEAVSAYLNHDKEYEEDKDNEEDKEEEHKEPVSSVIQTEETDSDDRIESLLFCEPAPRTGDRFWDDLPFAEDGGEADRPGRMDRLIADVFGAAVPLRVDSATGEVLDYARVCGSTFVSEADDCRDIGDEVHDDREAVQSEPEAEHSERVDVQSEPEAVYTCHAGRRDAAGEMHDPFVPDPFDREPQSSDPAEKTVASERFTDAHWMERGSAAPVDPRLVTGDSARIVQGEEMDAYACFGMENLRKWLGVRAEGLHYETGPRSFGRSRYAGE